MNNGNPVFNGLFDSIADLSRPTHKLTTVEAVDFTQLAKEHAQRLNEQVEEQRKKLSFVYDNLAILYKNSQDNSESLIAIAELFKFHDFEDICGLTLDFVDKKFPQELQAYINKQL